MSVAHVKLVYEFRRPLLHESSDRGICFMICKDLICAFSMPFETPNLMSIQLHGKKTCTFFKMSTFFK